MTEIVRAQGLTKKYNGFTAVKGIDFTVRPGECFGFLGPNGAGKTTTIKMICCFTPVTAGTLCLCLVQCILIAMKSRITPPYGELYLQSKFALCFGVLFNGHANLDQSVDVDRTMLDHQIIPAAAITFVALTVAACDRNYR